MKVERGWTLDEALVFLRAAIPEADRAGWLLGLYGSVVTNGHGRDLDLLAEPMRYSALPGGLMVALERAAGVRLTRSPEDHCLFAVGCLLGLPDGRVVDLRIGDGPRSIR